MPVFLAMLSGCFSPAMGCADRDGDDYVAGLCGPDRKTEPLDADENANVYPGAPEICDGLDNDLDDQVDEGLPDADEDGTVDCLDCAPGDATVSPSAIEVGDGLDNDCDGDIDEGMPAEVTVDVIQDLLRQPDNQVVTLSCDLCTSDATFAILRSDGSSAADVLSVVDTSVVGTTVSLEVDVSAGADLGYYAVAWNVRNSGGTIDDAVRLSRGKVEILDPSGDQIILDEPDPVDLVVEGWNFEWMPVVTLTDAEGQTTDCTVDDVTSARIECHYDDAYLPLAEGTVTLSVRDYDDSPDCYSYTQDCAEITLVR